MKKNFLLYLIFFLVLFSHFFLLKDGVIPFQFDHGKDSLAVMDMWLNKNPKLIGPWTSIPGLYFGPAWYYLLLPAFLIGAWNPVSAVWLMVLLLLVQIYLAYRYLGKEEAFIMATAPMWLMISTSAWNPFPMTFVSLIILIILKIIKEKKKFTRQQLFLLFFTASLGCHFSTAFAVLYPLLILFSFFINKFKLNFKEICLAIFAYALPFSPQLLFELTHNFLETRAVIAYFKVGEAHSFGLEKIKMVFDGLIGQFKITVLPDFYYSEFKFLNYSAIGLFILMIFLIFLKKKRQVFKMPAEYLFWFGLSFLLFVLLHYNVWYLLALAPLMAMITGDILRASNKYLKFIFISLLVISLFTKLFYFEQIDKDKLSKVSNFLPAKIEAIDIIRKDSAGRDFNSYQYAPDIYDFSYQYIYFWQALRGEKLPADFSYQPKEIIYIVQKNELLNYFNHSGEPAQLNYFIVEPTAMPDYQQAWWGKFNLDQEKDLSKLKNNSQLIIYRQNPK
ncbi:MAG: hypothetical protein UT13_C0001G0472 [Candidatus Pacebacteria bacterium GW2011_GWF2_38_9]|nr:MAG: hypothetical protein US01_C0001G0485 [candidate division TM6 bacterium GW2011_GWF2_28_16]KKQ10215.1 MAG: hypothetical protein US20_C0002G0016 [Candidatus Pacebacteria bacterium GW2011_GWF1_36_5]KKQ88825.1 MAG: hypothetical protein UT13_C0001G0472 [Candidatus Pacebacteria bacterium GW2011_GWF2_38_9]HAZ73236.1 hypothetical protein [Candidatus Paceibacterota bacterium]